MILLDFMFLLLLIGTSKASTDDKIITESSSTNFDVCFVEFFRLLPQAFISKELHISHEMKKSILDCVERETKQKGLLGFFDLFGSSKEIEKSCDSSIGCSEEDDQEEDEVKENKYSFLHCLDEHARDLMECMSDSFIDTIRDFITMPNPEQNLNSETLMCSIVQSFLPCTRKVSLAKCGKDGSDLVREELEREHKDIVDACDEVLIVKLNYT